MESTRRSISNCASHDRTNELMIDDATYDYCRYAYSKFIF